MDDKITPGSPKYKRGGAEEDPPGPGPTYPPDFLMTMQTPEWFMKDGSPQRQNASKFEPAWQQVGDRWAVVQVPAPTGSPERREGGFKYTQDAGRPDPWRPGEDQPSTALVGCQFARTRSGVNGWMLESLATDPEDERYLHYNRLNVEERAGLEQQVGVPIGHWHMGKSHYSFSDKRGLEDQNAQMMEAIQQRAFQDTSAAQKLPSQVMKDRQEAFGMFQHVSLEDNCNYIHAFDLSCALAAAGLREVGDHQPTQLCQNFGIGPAGLVTFDQFNHMCDLVHERVQPPDELPEMPGSPRYDKGPGMPKVEPVQNPGDNNWHKKMYAKIQMPSNVDSQFFPQDVASLPADRRPDWIQPESKPDKESKKWQEEFYKYKDYKRRPRGVPAGYEGDPGSGLVE